MALLNIYNQQGHNLTEMEVTGDPLAETQPQLNLSDSPKAM